MLNLRSEITCGGNALADPDQTFGGAVK